MDRDGSLEGVVARVKALLAGILEDVEPGDIAEDLPLFEAEDATDGLEIDSLDGLSCSWP